METLFEDTQDELQAIENESLAFANITQIAHQLAPIMAKTFEVRIKSNNEAFQILKSAYSPWPNKGLTRGELLGKKLRVKVNWGALGGVLEQQCLFIDAVDVPDVNFVVHPNNVRRLFTNIGDMQSMLGLWKHCKGMK